MYAYAVFSPSNLLTGTLVYQPSLKQKSDADIMRDAKMEAMGLRPDDHEPPKHKHNRMATDDVVSGDSRCDELLLIRSSRSWSVSRSVCESETAWYFFLDPGQIPEFGSGTCDAHGSVLEVVVQPTCRIRSLLTRACI